jgi:hypothetical protein
MKSNPRLHLLLASGLALTSLWSVAPAPLAPSPFELARRASAVENETGGFVLYQPFNHADGQVPLDPFPKNGKQYSVTTVRWVAVGFLRVEEGDEEGQLSEHWFLSKTDTTTSQPESPVPFVEKYYWPGRATPAADKHVDWNDLPVRFQRRNDLSGTVDLAEFIAEVGSVYGFALAATEGKFERYDHTAAKAAGY